MSRQTDAAADRCLAGANAADSRWRGVVLVASAVSFGGAILVIAAGEEPYHIDELRQVRSYGRPLADVVRLSLGQQQPPLDALVNNAVQSVIGIGDIRQRAVSVLAGIGALGLLGWLVLKALGPIPALASVVSLAISPLFVSVTAYARPYALPLFLMLTFTVAADRWLRRQSTSCGITLALSALLLPLSRTTEPPLFLAAAAVSILVFERDGRAWHLRRCAWFPVGVAIAASGLVAAPVVLRLRREVTSFTSAEATLFDRLARLVTDLPATLGEVLPAWPVLAFAFAALIGVPAVSRRLAGLWWFWPLAGLPFAFAVLFFQQANPSQPYFARYAFTFLLPLAILIGGATAAVLEGWRTRRRVLSVLAAVSIGFFMLMNFATLRVDLATQTNADFETAATAVKLTTPPGSLVVFDSVRPLGAYRTPFAGSPRYIDSRWKLPLTTTLASAPQLVPPSAAVYVLLLGGQPNVRGWIGAPVSRQFWLYQPVDPVYGDEGVVAAATAFGRAIGGTRGTSFLIAAAAVLRAQGEDERAQAIVIEAAAMSGPVGFPALRTAVDNAGLSDLLPP